MLFVREKFDLSFAVRFNADICQCLPSGTHGFTLIWLLRPVRTLLFVQMTVDRRTGFHPCRERNGLCREHRFAYHFKFNWKLNDHSFWQNDELALVRRSAKRPSFVLTFCIIFDLTPR